MAGRLCGAGNPARSRLSGGWTRWKAGPQAESLPHTLAISDVQMLESGLGMNLR